MMTATAPHYRFFTVVGRVDQRLDPFLYDHSEIVASVTAVIDDRAHYLIRTTSGAGASHVEYLANYQRDRIASGLFGVSDGAIFGTAQEAQTAHRDVWPEVNFGYAEPTVRVLIAIDVPQSQAYDVVDLAASVEARVADEAGYLDDGSPIIPSSATVVVLDDDTRLTPASLRGVYEVGIDGVTEEEDEETAEEVAAIVSARLQERGALN